MTGASFFDVDCIIMSYMKNRVMEISVQVFNLQFTESVNKRSTIKICTKENGLLQFLLLHPIVFAQTFDKANNSQ